MVHSRNKNSIIHISNILVVFSVLISFWTVSAAREATSLDAAEVNLALFEGTTQYPVSRLELPIIERPLQLNRIKRGAAYAGGYNDFSGIAKQSTFAALGSYGGFLQRRHAPTGYLSVPMALGAYGQYVPGGHKGPTVLSSGGYGQGGLLFGKI